MRRYEMRENIFRHSLQVMKVSMALVDNLKPGAMLQADLVVAGALLHDIAKTRTLQTKEPRHDLIGAAMLRELGYEEVAQIVESHVVFNDFQPRGRLEEREIVFYADKRVMHDRVVSLDERISDLVERYGINERVSRLIKENKELVLQIESKIQSFLLGHIDELVTAIAVDK